ATPDARTARARVAGRSMTNLRARLEGRSTSIDERPPPGDYLSVWGRIGILPHRDQPLHGWPARRGLPALATAARAWASICVSRAANRQRPWSGRSWRRFQPSWAL